MFLSLTGFFFVEYSTKGNQKAEIVPGNLRLFNLICYATLQDCAAAGGFPRSGVGAGCAAAGGFPRSGVGADCAAAGGFPRSGVGADCAAAGGTVRTYSRPLANCRRQ